MATFFNKILGILLLFASVSTPLLAQAPGQPANSWVSGSNWFCQSGFQKSGNECVSIFASTGGVQPANSWVSGSNWFCQSGFQKSGNECVSIFASTGGVQPANSWVSGSNWFCQSGFQKSGNECVSIFTGGNTNSASNTVPGLTTPNTTQPQYPSSPVCAENGSCYGDISPLTGRPKTTAVQGYYRKDGTYVRGHYRSK